MTPATVLTATIARLTAAGLTEARSPLGVVAASNQRINRGFSVLPANLSPAPRPDRGRSNTAGLRVEQSLSVSLSHAAKPGDGQAAPNQALLDLHSVWAKLSVAGTTLTTGGAIRIGRASTSYEGGGAYLITNFDLTVTYNLDLT